MATTKAPPPSVTDIVIPTPPPADNADQDALDQFLWQFSKSTTFNAVLSRQARAVLLSLFGKSLAEIPIVANATTISSPPTQAQVISVQATVNQLVTQLNVVTALLGTLVDAINANLKSLPATNEEA